jgi:hypothetical protein
VNPRRGKPNYTVLAIGVLIAVVGVAALLGGVIIQQPIVGVLGFAVMFVGVLLAVAPPRRRGTVADAPPASSSRKGGSSRFMDTLNERWDQRQDGGRD